jgi:hypothetical protein
MGLLRDRSLGVFFIALFLVSWAGQLVTQWLQFRSEHDQRGSPAAFWSEDFWVTFGQATFENWQSEFLQVASFVIATAYLVYLGSSESGDGEHRVEAKLDALLREQGIDPNGVELALPRKYRRSVADTAPTGSKGPSAP